MGDNWNWRYVLWLLLKPALVAAIVALLVALGVTGLRQSWQDPQLGVMGTTHLSGPLQVTGGIQTGNNFTMSTGSLINSSGGITITDDLLMHGGSIADVTGAVTVADSLRVNSQVSAVNGVAVTGNVTVTGAGSFSSQLTASNGIANTGNITSSGGITVTSFGRFYGMVLQPATTLAITANYGITPGNYSLIYIQDDGGQATGTVTLDSTTSVVNGTYVGQLLYVIMIDTDGATITIKDNGNIQLPGGADLALGANDVLVAVWNGTDWIAIDSTDN